MQQFNYRIALACITCLVAFTGARAQEHSGPCVIWDALPSTHHVSRHCETLTPRRIVIVTSQNRQDRLREQDIFASSLATHLSRSGKFEVVVGDTPIRRDNLPMRSGTFDEHHLLRLAKKYGVDSVLYCDVQQISGYDPMQADVAMLLVDVNDSVALVSAKSSYDLRDAIVASAYQRYSRACAAHSVLDVNRHTPKQFLDFVANHFAGAVLSVW